MPVKSGVPKMMRANEKSTRTDLRASEVEKRAALCSLLLATSLTKTALSPTSEKTVITAARFVIYEKVPYPATPRTLAA